MGDFITMPVSDKEMDYPAGCRIQSYSRWYTSLFTCCVWLSQYSCSRRLFNDIDEMRKKSKSTGANSANDLRTVNDTHL